MSLPHVTNQNMAMIGQFDMTSPVLHLAAPPVLPRSTSYSSQVSPPPLSTPPHPTLPLPTPPLPNVRSAFQAMFTDYERFSSKRVVIVFFTISQYPAQYIIKYIYMYR